MKKAVVFILIFAVILTGCADTKVHSKGVYMLLDTDTSGTYPLELKKALLIINYLLGTLQPLDTLALARIDTGNFGEKDIIAKVTFNRRPSVANNQKRAFQKRIGNFISKVTSSRYTDISGGILQAIEHLNEADPGKKYILIFSDLKEELKKEHVRDVPFQLSGFHIIALNLTKLSADILDPKKYLKRIEQWRAKVESGNGKWRVVNDLEQFENIFAK
ncbi:MAG: VWA domain-containing protein [Deltaproteobacteria bacterium]|nr:VWA domain-containing protein [Deltaproteobacteria bacterium]